MPRKSPCRPTKGGSVQKLPFGAKKGDARFPAEWHYLAGFPTRMAKSRSEVTSINVSTGALLHGAAKEPDNFCNR